MSTKAILKHVKLRLEFEMSLEEQINELMIELESPNTTPERTAKVREAIRQIKALVAALDVKE